MPKIQEIQIEPSRIEIGSTFKLKIRAIRYAIYEEIKIKTVSQLKEYTVGELKGE
jgi:hypothetical protein